ncbi:MAG: nucleotidyltransferase [Crocinitomicaceae bacterium]|nr:nucleotidyltransferase [Crocinitomicaceae bacterium]
MNSKDINKHIIKSSSSIRDAMNQLNDLGADGVLFIINNENQLIGSLTDGDIRRGLLNEVSIEELVTQIYHSNPRFVRSEENNVSILKSYRNLDLKIVPVVNGENQITDIINFNKQFSFLPVDVVIMAGGKGTRLLPLTEELPKPLLCVGDQPIIDHLMNRLSFFGVKNIVVSVNHFGDQIIKHLKSKESNFNLKIITEKFPMGTIGSISLIDSYNNDSIVVCNADLLTDVDYEDFYLDFINSKADLSVLTIPYNVAIPYGVLESDNGFIKEFKEKPNYVHDVNGGIYLIKKDALKEIPKDKSYSASDFIADLIHKNYKVRSYSHKGYWLDIGRPDDYKKAQTEINLFK